MFAATIQGMTSFGFALVAVPLLSFFLDISLITPLLVLYSFVLNLIIFSRIYKNADFKSLKFMMIGGVLGIPAGTYLLKNLDSDLLKLMVGILVVVFGLILLRGITFRLKNEKKAYLPIGLVSGVLQGAVALSGPPIVLFLSNQGANKDKFRASLSSYFLLLNFISLPMFFLSGLFTSEVLMTSLKASPGMIIGVVLGLKLSNKIDEKTFKKITLALIIVMGFMNIVNVLLG